MGFGGTEIILIFLVVLLLFGAKKLPELAKGLGSGIKEFKKSMKEVSEPVEDVKKEIESEDLNSDDYIKSNKNNKNDV